jgi:hypothetical protein
MCPVLTVRWHNTALFGSTVFRSECCFPFIQWTIRRRCAKPHGVSHRPVTALKRVPSRASPCGICGTPELYIAPVSIIAPNLRTCQRQYVTLSINLLQPTGHVMQQ